MSDHHRLAALRRITVKRGATKAEAATAKRLADALEAKVGKAHTPQSRPKAKEALPEPSAARRRRIWGIRLDWASEKSCWIYLIGYASFFVISAPLALIILAFLLNLGDPHALEDWMLRLMILKYGTLAAVVCFAILMGAPITFASWWLRTMPGERLGRALVFIST